MIDSGEKGDEKVLPVSEENLERRDKLSQGNGCVPLQPLLVLLDILDKNEEVLAGALVVDLGLCALASSHFAKRVASTLKLL